MIERENNKLRLADYILHGNKIYAGIAAVERILAVVTHDKQLALGNHKITVFVNAEVLAFSLAFLRQADTVLNVGLGKLDAVNKNLVVFIVQLSFACEMMITSLLCG